MARRFELDETGAAERIGAQIAQHELWAGGDSAQPAAELEIGASYSPRDDWAGDGYDTQSIVYWAQGAGVLTGPGSVEFDYVSDGDAGYVWLVYLDGAGGLKLAGCYEKIHHLGDGSAPGVPAALGVLREAVSAANQMLADLAAYIAAQAT